MKDPQRAMSHLLYVYFENNDHIFTPYELLAGMSKELLTISNPDRERVARFISEKTNLAIEKVHFHGSDYLLDSIIEKLQEIHSA